ncbi:MotA/TolQ/ExbB proton channel family protein [Rubripirellula sp.]|jgi:biopolymer transport protein ExbB/TolQ|nr:MotA/TolQ/ExbB proton channel family protein [Planctomycetaceae bacterium]MDA9857146.1 MotA/TolQ/ExbB proton channel family protein [Rubripirellula sp.]MDF1841863.1 MotA/TolQ/ExbB proton channel family protein [Rubripirellula sp.]
MLLDFATAWFTPMILILGALHLVAFWVLRIWAGRDIRSLAQLLERFTDGFHHRSRLDWRGHLTDQVDAFVTDVRESLDNPNDREQLSQRISILDEQRPYLASFRFETCWNVARSGIEIYPLLGVLGTIFALWLAMREPASDSSATVGAIVERFGVAIDSTFAGLAMAILLMVVHSYYETLFTRLTENRRTVRDMVLQVKRELVTSSLSAEESKS